MKTLVAGLNGFEFGGAILVAVALFIIAVLAYRKELKLTDGFSFQGGTISKPHSNFLYKTCGYSLGIGILLLIVGRTWQDSIPSPGRMNQINERQWHGLWRAAIEKQEGLKSGALSDYTLRFDNNKYVGFFGEALNPDGNKVGEIYSLEIDKKGTGELSGVWETNGKIKYFELILMPGKEEFIGRFWPQGKKNSGTRLILGKK